MVEKKIFLTLKKRYFYGHKNFLIFKLKYECKIFTIYGKYVYMYKEVLQISKKK